MNAKSLSFVVVLSLSTGSMANASVTVSDAGWSGGINCYLPLTLVDTVGSIGMSADQSGGGQAWANITASDIVDPTLTINNTINNDTGFAWTEYIVGVTLNANFTIAPANTGVNAPPGWTANITQPVPIGGGNYSGTIDYLAGTPVAISPDPNSTFDFYYQITFSGLTQYTFTQTLTPVPEPGTLSLLTVGGLLLGGMVIAKRRQRKLRVAG
jgi:PEP-CTERM motif